MLTSSPKTFAEWFNDKYPGAYRQVGAEDVKDMTDSGLLYHRGYYSGSIDGETIRCVLQYEQMRKNRLTQQDKENKLLLCKICNQPLLPNPEGKVGRHREYCSECELARYRNRQKKSYYRRRMPYN